MILFLGFVFCVHHWNVSPEASMKETSNPGQARSFLRRVRNLVGGETCSQFCDCFAGGNVVPWQESTWMVLTPPTSTPTGMHPLAHIPPPPHTATHAIHSCACSVMSDSLDCRNPWTVPCQALPSMSMGFSRQEYWSGLPCPPPGNLPDPRWKPCLLCLLHGKQILYF